MKHGGPLHPQYATLEARLRTFREWPPALRQKPNDLAEAGFYYIGLSDQVKCFYCDGGLRNWQSEDEPWKEHARWFQKCVFVRLVKGDEYIAECLKERPPEGGEELSQGPRSVSEDEVRLAMSQAIVKQVLSMGIDASRVKMAIKKRLENSGNAFDTTESLISAAFSVQRNQERRSHNENLNPSGAVLGRLGESSASAGVLDMVSETWGEWGVGQEQRETLSMETEEAMEAMEELSQENSISLDRSQERLSPPAAVSQSSSAPPTPSVTTSELPEESPSLPVTSKSNDDLELENARLKEQRTCKICMDKEVCLMPRINLCFINLYLSGRSCVSSLWSLVLLCQLCTSFKGKEMSHMSQLNTYFKYFVYRIVLFADEVYREQSVLLCHENLQMKILVVSYSPLNSLVEMKFMYSTVLTCLLN